MCVDPMTAVSIGGAGMGAAGSLIGGFQNSDAYKLQAKIAQANAQTALAEGSGQVAQIGQRVQRAIGSQRAYYAGGNLNLGGGSPLLMTAISAQQGNTDQQLTLARSLNQAAGQNFVAGQDQLRAASSMTAGIFGAGTSLLSGLARWKGLGGFGVGAPMDITGTGSVAANPYLAWGAPSYGGMSLY
jgi:hypothetical protein